MNARFKPSPELVRLCGCARDDVLTPADLAALQGILAGDPAARRFYARFMQLHAVLERYEPAPAIAAARDAHAAGRRTVVRFLLPFAAAAMLAILLVRWLAPPAEAPAAWAVIDEASPTARVLRGDRHLRAAAGSRLQVGDIVLTTADCGVAIRFVPDNTVVGVFAHSRVILTSVADAKHLRVVQGRLLCDVAKQRPGRPLELHTPHAHAEVLGTSFVLFADEDKTSLRVNEGSVRVTDLASSASVETTAGWRAEVGRDTRLQLLRGEVAEAAEVRSVIAIDPATGQPLAGLPPLHDGAVLSLSELPPAGLNLRVRTAPEAVGAVRFTLTGRAPDGRPLVARNDNGDDLAVRSEIWQPFLVAGDDDRGAAPRPWSWRPEPGDYLLTVVPFADPALAGARGRELELHFRIVP